MGRRIPRLEVIEAFIEAAHAPTFRIAAERCALSPAAFSRRIQAFRDFVGREVFDREPGGMRLTQAGQECVARLEPLHRAMTEAARDLGATARCGRITVSLSHSLAVSWLFPRLDRFRARCPGVEVAIQTTRTAEAIRLGEADLGICASDVEVGGLNTQRLLDIDVTPVGSPKVAEAFRSGRAQLKDFPLLSPIHAPDMWRWWAETSGVDIGPLPASTTFDMAYALYEAAAAGWGLAPGMSATVDAHLLSGRLQPLGLPSARYPGYYSLVAKPSRMRAPAAAAFWSWLSEEANAARREPQTGLA
ncbi:MAG TPA: LysR substrate-binding domain-containing protein [Phenylobacterium sp.]|nr:LysR substrate-binding domain-containing protein [Phenylobacterium sp.]